MESHRMRVGALAWSSSLLSSGSRDKSILHHDIRAQEDYVSKLTGHKSEVMYPCFLIICLFYIRYPSD
jgi:cell division cycle 20-like protein 1, cofactor of APC complex